MASVEPAAALHVEPAAAAWRGKGERMAPGGRKGGKPTDGPHLMLVVLN